MEGKRDNGEKRGKCHQGACIKDSWTKPKGIGSWVGGREGWCGGGVEGGKWRHTWTIIKNKK